MMLVLHNARATLDSTVSEGWQGWDVHLHGSLDGESALVGAPRKIVGHTMAPTQEVLVTANFDDVRLRFWSAASGKGLCRDPSTMQGKYMMGSGGRLGSGS